ncbi:MAG: MBL fold metallo-hydrolase [Hyphomonadaceae bacterium]
MYPLSRRTLLTAAFASLATPASAADGAPDIWELAVEGMERVTSTVWVKLLTPNLWVTSFTFDAGERFGWIPCNGLIVADSEGPIIVDTGNNREQGETLLAITQRVTGRPAAKAIATHFHADRTGGGEAMRAADVPVYAHPFSVGLAEAYGFPTPTPVRGLEKEPVAMGPLELFFPGAGHTRDNITVWHAESRTLFGGCLLRATTDNQLGSMSDADATAFPATIARLAARYPERRIVIPGHGGAAGDAVAWTARLLAERTAPNNE